MPTTTQLPPGVFTLTDATAAGVSRATVYRWVTTGVLTRVAPGVFTRTVVHDQLGLDHTVLEAVTRAPQATLCLTSALVHHDLTDAIPPVTHLAVPRGTHRPRVGSTVCWHQFDPGTFTFHRDTTLIDSIPVPVYDAPRSIVDVFRLRSVTGYETGVHALRVWLTRPGCHPATLLDIAKCLPRALGPVREALQYLA